MDEKVKCQHCHQYNDPVDMTDDGTCKYCKTTCAKCKRGLPEAETVQCISCGKTFHERCIEIKGKKEEWLCLKDYDVWNRYMKFKDMREVETRFTDDSTFFSVISKKDTFPSFPMKVMDLLKGTRKMLENGQVHSDIVSILSNLLSIDLTHFFKKYGAKKRKSDECYTDRNDVDCRYIKEMIICVKKNSPEAQKPLDTKDPETNEDLHKTLFRILKVGEAANKFHIIHSKDDFYTVGDIIIKTAFMEYLDNFVQNACEDHLSSERTLFLRGPSGCGKTVSLSAIARQASNDGYFVVYFQYPEAIACDAYNQNGYWQLSDEGYRNVLVQMTKSNNNAVWNNYLGEGDLHQKIINNELPPFKSWKNVLDFVNKRLRECEKGVVCIVDNYQNLLSLAQKQIGTEYRDGVIIRNFPMMNYCSQGISPLKSWHLVLIVASSQHIEYDLLGKNDIPSIMDMPLPLNPVEVCAALRHFKSYFVTAKEGSLDAAAYLLCATGLIYRSSAKVAQCVKEAFLTDVKKIKDLIDQEMKKDVIKTIEDHHSKSSKMKDAQKYLEAVKKFLDSWKNCTLSISPRDPDHSLVIDRGLLVKFEAAAPYQYVTAHAENAHINYLTATYIDLKCECTSSTPQQIYPMTKKKIGYYVILNMLRYCKAAEESAKLIKAAFDKKIGFDVEEFLILEKGHYKDAIRQIQKMSFTEYNTVFVTVIARENDKDELLHEDKEENLHLVCRSEDICNIFNEIGDLEGKPVIILQESCHGQTGIVRMQQVGKTSQLTLAIRRQKEDMIVMRATTLDCVSNVGPEGEKGSLFIRTFVELFKRDYKNKDMESICLDIRAEVNEVIFTLESHKRGPVKCRKVPELTTTLTKKLYFFEYTKPNDILKDKLEVIKSVGRNSESIEYFLAEKTTGLMMGCHTEEGNVCVQSIDNSVREEYPFCCSDDIEQNLNQLSYLEIQSKEYLAICCGKCGITLFAPESRESPVRAFNKGTIRMCKGKDKLLYVLESSERKIVALDCSSTVFKHEHDFLRRSYLCFTGIFHMCYIPSEDTLVASLFKNSDEDELVAISCDESRKIVWKKTTNSTVILTYHPQSKGLLQYHIISCEGCYSEEGELHVLCPETGRLAKQITFSKSDKNDGIQTILDIVVSQGKVYVLFEREHKLFLGTL